MWKKTQTETTKPVSCAVATQRDKSETISTSASTMTSQPQTRTMSTQCDIQGPEYFESDDSDRDDEEIDWQPDEDISDVESEDSDFGSLLEEVYVFRILFCNEKHLIFLISVITGKKYLNINPYNIIRCNILDVW